MNTFTKIFSTLTFCILINNIAFSNNDVFLENNPYRDVQAVVHQIRYLAKTAYSEHFNSFENIKSINMCYSDPKFKIYSQAFQKWIENHEEGINNFLKEFDKILDDNVQINQLSLIIKENLQKAVSKQYYIRNYELKMNFDEEAEKLFPSSLNIQKH